MHKTRFGQWQEKNKGALVLGRDESPNQIRMQTWVEKVQLTPDVLSFQKVVIMYQNLSIALITYLFLAIEGLPLGNLRENSDFYGIYELCVTVAL